MKGSPIYAATTLSNPCCLCMTVSLSFFLSCHLKGYADIEAAMVEQIVTLSKNPLQSFPTNNSLLLYQLLKNGKGHTVAKMRMSPPANCDEKQHLLMLYFNMIQINCNVQK